MHRIHLRQSAGKDDGDRVHLLHVNEGSVLGGVEVHLVHGERDELGLLAIPDDGGDRAGLDPFGEEHPRRSFYGERVVGVELQADPHEVVVGGGPEDRDLRKMKVPVPGVVCDPRGGGAGASDEGGLDDDPRVVPRLDRQQLLEERVDEEAEPGVQILVGAKEDRVGRPQQGPQRDLHPLLHTVAERGVVDGILVRVKEAGGVAAVFGDGQGVAFVGESSKDHPRERVQLGVDPAVGPPDGVVERNGAGRDAVDVCGGQERVRAGRPEDKVGIGVHELVQHLRELVVERLEPLPGVEAVLGDSIHGRAMPRHRTVPRRDRELVVWSFDTQRFGRIREGLPEREAPQRSYDSAVDVHFLEQDRRPDSPLAEAHPQVRRTEDELCELLVGSGDRGPVDLSRDPAESYHSAEGSRGTMCE